MRAKPTKLPKPKRLVKKTTDAKTQRALAECEAWFDANWQRVMAAAKENTKRLTGRECL